MGGGGGVLWQIISERPELEDKGRKDIFSIFSLLKSKT